MQQARASVQTSTNNPTSQPLILHHTLVVSAKMSSDANVLSTEEIR